MSSMRGSGLSSGCLKFISGDPSFHFLSTLRKKAPPNPRTQAKDVHSRWLAQPSHDASFLPHKVTAYFTNEETEARASMWWGLKLNLNDHITCYHQTLKEFE